MLRSLGLLRRLHDAVRRLYPRRGRRTHGWEVRAHLDRLLREAEDDIERRRVLRRALRDAIRTLPSAWRYELGRRWAMSRTTRTTTGTGRMGMRMSGWGQDLRFALRNLRRRPLFAVVATVTLGIAFGANAAVYSIAESTFFRTLPYESPDRVMRIDGELEYIRESRGDGRGWGVTADFRELPGIEAAGLFVEGAGANLAGTEGVRRLDVAHVSGSFFEVMGVAMRLGAGFREEEPDPNTVVISHRVWVDAFGSDPGVVGRTTTLSGMPFTIVGVAPMGVNAPGETDLWIPQPLRYELISGAVAPDFVARIAEGADRAEVQALLRERTPLDDREPPLGFNRTPPPSLVPLRDALVADLKEPLRILSAAAVLVLLLGALNLAGVTSSQYLERERELSVRMALGADRPRVYRQLFIETLVVGGLGALAALGIASLGVPLLASGLPGEIYGLQDARVGPGTLLVIAALAVVTSAVITLLPARLAVGRNADPGRSGGASSSLGQVRLQGALITGQLTVAVLLVAGAVLLGRSLSALLDVPLGIDTRHVLTAQVQLNTDAYQEAEERRAYLDQVVERVSALPGVTAVGATSQLPLQDGMTMGFRLKRREDPEDAGDFAIYKAASAGYFEAIGARLVLGRTFDGRAETRDEVVLSRSAALQLAGTVDVVGDPVDLKFGNTWEALQIVGVVEDIRHDGPEGDPSPTVYLELTGSSSLGLAVRSAGDPALLAPALTRVLREIDGSAPPFNVRTTRQALSREVAGRRSLTLVSSLFAAIAIVLAVIGLFGMVAGSVVRRRRELGIRIALGASEGSVVGLVVRRGVRLMVVGMALAVPIGLVAKGLIEGQLFEVSAADPLALIGTPLLLGLVGLIASWIPARRAARLDPVEVLGAE